LDNPCTTLSNVGSVTNWYADFSNSRCIRTAIEDSGWIYNFRYKWMDNYTTDSEYHSFRWDNISFGVQFYFGDTKVLNGYTYHRGTLMFNNGSSGNYSSEYSIKRTRIIDEVKYFSNF
jgi:hypothetical protein